MKTPEFPALTLEECEKKFFKNEVNDELILLLILKHSHVTTEGIKRLVGVRGVRMTLDP